MWSFQILKCKITLHNCLHIMCLTLTFINKCFHTSINLRILAYNSWLIFYLLCMVWSFQNSPRSCLENASVKLFVFRIILINRYFYLVWKKVSIILFLWLKYLLWLLVDLIVRILLFRIWIVCILWLAIHWIKFTK